ncbi:MAG TPA: hypothetical protein VNU46_03175 [Gemmatimonadaceae bacterium]|nr:hypothetical protein [Gemmatimonadaceae bacterium]
MSDTDSVVPPRPTWEQVDRYATGDATPAEVAVVHAYRAIRPEYATVVDRLVHAVRQSAASVLPIDVSAMLAAAHERITQHSPLHRMTRTLLDGSAEQVVAMLVGMADPPLHAEEVARLRRMIAQAKREGR